MNKNFFIIITAVLIAAGFGSCRKADPVIRKSENELSDIFVTMADRTNERLAEPMFSTNHDTVYFDVPWYYPANSDNEIDITKLILKATIPTDAVISPALGAEMDLTNPLKLTVTAGDGSQSNYVVVARKVGDVSISSIKISFSVAGVDQEVEGVVQGNEVLFYVVPGTDVSNATLTYDINRHSTGSIPYGSSVDFSQAVPFTITGVGGVSKEYTLKTAEPVKLNYGAGISHKMWTKTGGDLGFTPDNETSLAVNGDYLIVASHNVPSQYRVFNRFTGAYVKDMFMPFTSDMSMQIVNDDAGHLLATNYSTVNGTFYVYRYTNVDDTNPVKLIEWVNTTPSSDPSWIGALGRAVNVYGDVDNNAVITATGSFTNIFQRWVITNGQLVSNTPEQITYAGTDNFGTWSEVQPTSTSPTGDYFVDYQSEVALVNGITNERTKAFTFGWPVVYTRPMAYAKFNNANYLAIVRFINTYDLNQVTMSIFDVTQTSRIDISPSDPDYSSFNIFTSDLLTASGAGTTADICIGFSDNGERMQVYMLLTNGGIMAHEFTNYAP